MSKYVLTILQRKSGEQADSSHQMLLDSSVGSVIAAPDDRHVFFQSQNGAIREAVYSDNSWLSSVAYTLSTDGRSHTPLSAVYLPAAISGFTDIPAAVSGGNDITGTVSRYFK